MALLPKTTRRNCVAPLAGAWIEMPDAVAMELEDESLPSRERGLKFKHRLMTTAPIGSLPSRERGLKYAWSSTNHAKYDVAPLAGAWIEIDSAG